MFNSLYMFTLICTVIYSFLILNLYKYNKYTERKS